MFIKLTERQLEYLTDRLYLTDCLVDVLGQESDSEPCFYDGTVIEVAMCLERGVKEDGIDCTEAMEVNSDCCKKILADCVNGSTIYSRLSTDENGDELPSSVRTTVARTGNTLAAKIEKATGEKCVFPMF